ncbi:MAG: hypothetical protein FWC91_03870 [Defluviitaleaceae bacterium]|nr:hypothetical protein [Defluviitaleaceae bacterium]
MQCKIHPTENGVNTCNQCGCWLCEKCTFERSGRMFCPDCAAQQATDVAKGSGTSSTATSSRWDERKHVSRYISWGLLFLFTAVIPLPGLNYMYMGFIKRGLVAMGAFFGTIYMGIHFSGGAFGHIGALFLFAIPIIWTASAFDGFKLRSRLNAGEVITDDLDDIINFFRRNRMLFAGIIIILASVQVIGLVLPGILRVLRNLVPILIALWAIKTLFKKTK